RMGGIYVDRDGFDFGFVTKSEDVLRGGGVVGIFPESRIPKPGEERPLEFKTSAAYIALRSDAPVIPVVTNGSYFSKKRARVMIGEPINVRDLSDPGLGEKEDLKNVSAKLRERIIELEKKLYEEGEKGKS
ncbi:MAG: 1-acyl-sn-glycerol-3-phosphate acyltransferase, partial [Clostridia bacterium]|nr:1-acyl-sn-glycerol-3-phosphate acyltransferase [Clostridia bacterium]